MNQFDSTAEMFKTVMLDRIRFRYAKKFSLEMTKALDGGVNFWSQVDYEMGHVMIGVDIEIFGKKHPEKHIIRFPENWIESLKERFMPAFMRDRWPVKYKVFSAQLTELYPGFCGSIPDRNPTLNIIVMNKLESPLW